MSDFEIQQAENIYNSMHELNEENKRLAQRVKELEAAIKSIKEWVESGEFRDIYNGFIELHPQEIVHILSIIKKAGCLND